MYAINGALAVDNGGTGKRNKMWTVREKTGECGWRAPPGTHNDAKRGIGQITIHSRYTMF